MKTLDSKKSQRLLLAVGILMLVSGIIILFFLFQNKNSVNPITQAPISFPQPTVTTITKDITINKAYTFDIEPGLKFQNQFSYPNYIKFKNNKITISATKYSAGTYHIMFVDPQDNIVYYKINITPKELDLGKLQARLKSILGSKLNQYSIHLNDLTRDQIMDINRGKIVEPASIAKLPVAVLILRDVDAGKITLKDTYPIKDSEKFSTIGNIGGLPNGTKVTFKYYLENLIQHSDNNAWYALVHYLGNSYQGVNPRVIKELGVNPLFLDPAKGTAKGVGKILADVYNAKTLTKKSADYLIGLMENADDWARQGVGLGLPDGTRFANKIGTLQAGDKISYQDGAIVWAPKSDYILVVMDENISWGEGANTIKEISEAVYDYLN